MPSCGLPIRSITREKAGGASVPQAGYPKRKQGGREG